MTATPAGIPAAASELDSWQPVQPDITTRRSEPSTNTWPVLMLEALKRFVETANYDKTDMSPHLLGYWTAFSYILIALMALTALIGIVFFAYGLNTCCQKMKLSLLCNTSQAVHGHDSVPMTNRQPEQEHENQPTPTPGPEPNTVVEPKSTSQNLSEIIEPEPMKPSQSDPMARRCSQATEIPTYQPSKLRMGSNAREQIQRMLDQIPAPPKSPHPSETE